MVMEEYRMRVESSPQGKLMQAFLATAFEAHPYRDPPGRLAERYREPAAQARRGSSSRILRTREHHHRRSWAT